ncbi:MAG TPA: YhgE/Pip family protein [Dermatophilaceae bacterium]|nr:YhgE/Pip family protein [Dermatophilaceae bacterium]
MTSPLPVVERVASVRPATWRTWLGLFLIPAVLGGLLVWTVWRPAERIKNITAAVVNLDTPVTVKGQTVPLGRVLAGQLVTGAEPNLTWVLTDETDANEGLRQARYAAVLTIPASFSAAATSTAGSPAKATQAQLDLRSAEDTAPVDRAISQNVAATATRALGSQLATTYLDNIYLGFSTLHDRLGEAASGAGRLSSGSGQLARGVTSLSAALGELADGTDRLTAGAQRLAAGDRQLAAGMRQLASGTSGLSQVSRLRSGSGQLSAGVAQTVASIRRQSAQAGQLSAALTGIVRDCQATSTDPDYCARLAAQVSAVAGQISPPSAAELARLQQLASGAAALDRGVTQLAAEVPALQSGIRRLADGAAASASGSAALAAGVARTATGADRLAGGAASLSTGAAQLNRGVTDLASGLRAAGASVPTYSASERVALSKVAATPVVAGGVDVNSDNADSAGLFAVLALWGGALATFVVLRAVPRRVWRSRDSTRAVVGRTLLTVAVLAVVQALLFSAVTAGVTGRDWIGWLGLLGVMVAVDLTFLVVNAAVAAMFGNAGRFAAAVVVVVTLLGGLWSGAPGLVTATLAVLPTEGALRLLRVVLVGGQQGASGAVILGAWLLVGAVLLVLATERLRRVRLADPAY